MNPAKDLASFLEGQVSYLSTSSNVFWGPVRATSADVPKEAVFCTPMGGPNPDSDVARSSELRRVVILIVVRSGSNDSGYSTAKDCFEAIQGASISGYQDVFVTISEPESGRYTDTGLLLWTFGVQMVYEDAA